MSAIGLRRVNPSRWLVAAALAVIVQLVCTKTPPSEFLSFDDSVEYPPPDAQGNPEMFSSLPLAPEAETQLQTHTDTHYRTLPIPPTSHEGDEDIDAAIQHLSVVVHEQPEIEEINSALLEAATGCTMPRVSMANPVLTDGAHWKVFAKCVLQTTPQGQLLYGFVPELQQYGSAAGLMWSMNQLALLKHKMWQRPNAEKLNYLERLVVATRFRLPTLAEKNAAAAAIEENGIVNASFIYLMNWYYSLYYQKHFDYAKRPSPRYSSYIVSGRFVNAQNQNLQGVKYSVPIEFLAGCVLKGITGANGA
ncbi:MAG TPA: hypothetical protein PLY93_14275, partial [Turneriella sp.]|nr:hypothetical protein [Turneriella sp.]